jgi:segregation and condensation protein B
VNDRSMSTVRRTSNMAMDAIIASMPRSRRAAPIETTEAPSNQDERQDRPTGRPRNTGAETLVAGLPASLLSLEQLRSAVESLLFVAGRPLELSELRRLLLVEEKRLREAVAALAEECELRGRGMRVLRTGEAIQLVSAPENARFVAALLGLPSQVKLTTAALDTLAVVAFRQPITRSQIEFVRGVNSDRALASLIQYGLVVEVGRANTVGRPALFGTTPEFLQQFGLTTLDELPRPDLSDADTAEIARQAAAQTIRAAVGAEDNPAGSL